MVFLAVEVVLTVFTEFTVLTSKHHKRLALLKFETIIYRYHLNYRIFFIKTLNNCFKHKEWHQVLVFQD